MSVVETHSQIVFSARLENKTLIAAVRGEIDISRSPDMRGVLLATINEQQPLHVVLNLAEVQYMDSSGVAVMVEVLRKVKPNQGKVFLTNLQPRVKGLLEIARLNTIFQIRETEADALSDVT